MKQRFSGLDIRATVTELRSRLLGLRLANVYDINAKTFLFKFARTDHKELLLIESGIRLHLTDFARDKPNIPSGFAMKLRKHIRTRKLNEVRQLGVDRVVDFVFGAGETCFHVIAEFYAAGNIILTDYEYKILALLRVVAPSEDIRYAVGEIFNSNNAKPLVPITMDRLLGVLSGAAPKDPIKKVLNITLENGPALNEHAITTSGLALNSKISDLGPISAESPKIISLFEALQKADAILNNLGSEHSKGYIIMKKDVDIKAGENSAELYEEFHPCLFQQHIEERYKEFPTFEAAVDEFFSSIESQKLDLKAKAAEANAVKKLEAARHEYQQRLAGLEAVQTENVRKAYLIEANQRQVDDAILVVRSAIANAMDWKQLSEIIEDQTKRGNPVASLITGLKLEVNQITLSLRDHTDANEDDDDDEVGDFSEDEEEDGGEAKRIANRQKKIQTAEKVDVDINTSAYANARRYYDMKRATAAKQEKTIKHTVSAMKSAERRIKADLKESQVSTSSIKRIRKPFWFEKFSWFISSENYLVIAGRDMQQNELIVKKYMRKGDLFLHADIHGASSVVIKNPTGEPVPPSTLAQAGNMAMCHSSAWSAKIVTSAYWVYDDQVSKTAPSGEFLTTGSFMIRGKKNFLPPTQLVYGYGLLFLLAEESIGNHLDERKPRTLGDGDDASIFSADTAPSSAVTDANGDDDDKNEDDGNDEDKNEDDENENDEDNEQKDETNYGSDENDEKIEERDQSKYEAEEAAISRRGNEASADPVDVSKEEDEVDEEEDEDEMEFPDTVIPTSLSAVQSSTSWSNSSARSDLPPRSPTPSSSMQDFVDSTADSSKDLETDGKRKKYISAKERRQLKKGKSAAPEIQNEKNDSHGQKDNEDDDQDDDQEDGNDVLTDRKTKLSNNKASAQQPPKVRGKKGKLKKIKEKYADQDDEERDLRMSILASSGKKKSEEQLDSESNNKKQRGKSGSPASTIKGRPSSASTNSSAKSKKSIEKEPTSTSSPSPSPLNTTSTSTDAVVSVDETMQDDNIPLEVGQDEDEDAEIRALLKEDNQTMPEDIKDATFLNTLTGQPLHEDVILHAVAVCAPYNALHNYKYKIKLTPGTLSKGKAAKSALNSFSRSPNVTSREKELMKLIPEAELMQCMLAKVKLLAPNLQSAKKSAKKDKSKASRNNED